MSTDWVNAVLIALEEDSILLPNLAVAEVLAKEALQKAGDGTATLAGHVQWNGRQIPVINFETLNGAAPKQEISKRSRVTLLHSIGGNALTVGVMTQGYPHLVTLNREAVQPAALRDTDRSDLVIARVRISNQEVLVPDFETIENELLRLSAPDAATH